MSRKNTRLEYEWNHRRELTRVRDAEEHYTSLQRDMHGYVRKITHETTGHTRSMDYDPQGQLVRLLDEEGSVYQWAYHPTWGLPTWYQGPRGAISTLETSQQWMDDYGTRWETCDAENACWVTTYDGLGRVARIWAKGYTDDAIEYNELGHIRASISNIDMPTEATSYREYDSVGRLVGLVSAESRRRGFKYDFLGRMTEQYVGSPCRQFESVPGHHLISLPCNGFPRLGAAGGGLSGTASV